MSRNVGIVWLVQFSKYLESFSMIRSGIRLSSLEEQTPPAVWYKKRIKSPIQLVSGKINFTSNNYSREESTKQITWFNDQSTPHLILSYENSTPQVSHLVMEITNSSHFISPRKNQGPILSVRGRTYCQPYHSSQTKTLLESVYSQVGPRWRRVDPGGGLYSPDSLLY